MKRHTVSGSGRHYLTPFLDQTGIRVSDDQGVLIFELKFSAERGAGSEPCRTHVTKVSEYSMSDGSRISDISSCSRTFLHFSGSFPRLSTPFDRQSHLGAYGVEVVQFLASTPRSP
jgi:hypothetical protein